jgi:hypothetical protein
MSKTKTVLGDVAREVQGRQLSLREFLERCLHGLVVYEVARCRNPWKNEWWHDYDSEQQFELEVFDEAELAGNEEAYTFGFTLAVGWPPERLKWGKDDMIWSLEKVV